MKPALTYNLTESLYSWEQFPNGDELKQLENDIVNERLKTSFGHHLLKLGHLTSSLDTSSCLIKHQVNVAPKLFKQSSIGLVAEYEQLPLSTSSIDLILINHELEFSNDPHQLLREVHRVLMPNGNVVLSVFNPVSLLIINKLLSFKSGAPLQQARMFPLTRIKDWLVLLGFEIIEQEYCCYSTLLTNQKPLNWCQRAIKSALPYMGSVCVITAKKREWPLTPIRNKRRFKSSFHPAVSRTSSKVIEK